MTGLKLTEYRKLVKGLSDEQKEKLIMDLYKRGSKQEKQMQEVVADLIREGKELPPTKAKVPDLKSAHKDLDKLETIAGRYFSYRYYKPGPFRLGARRLIRELPLCPVQAENYDEAVEILVQLYLMMCDDCRLRRANRLFELAGTSRSELYYLICTLRLAKGYKKEILDKCICLPVFGEGCDAGVYLQDYEMFISLLKNGDLRLEVIDLCKERINFFLHTKDDQIDMEYWTDISRARRAALTVGLCWYALEREESGREYAEKQARKLFGPLANEFLAFWSDAAEWLKYQKEKEQHALEDDSYDEEYFD